MAVLVAASLSSTYANQRKTVRLSDGTLYSVYYDPARDIYIKKSTDNGATWTDETLLSTYLGMDTNFQVNPSIAVDSADNLHVVWMGRATGYATYEIWYVEYDGAWSDPVRISDFLGMNTDHQRYPSIAVDGSDNLHVVWDGQATGFATADQIWYNKYDGAWAGPVRISDFVGMHLYEQSEPGITVDSAGNLHVAWYGKATGFITDDQIWYNTYSGGAWAGPVRISDFAGMNTNPNIRPSIAVDSNDYIHVAWYGKATGFLGQSQIWYNTYSGGAWAGPVRISDFLGMNTFNQVYPSIAVGSDNYIHVVWSGQANIGFQKIWRAKYVTSWGTPELLQDMGSDLTSPNIRWSRYPLTNIPTLGIDYVFLEGAANIYWDMVGNPFASAPTVTTNPATEVT